MTADSYRQPTLNGALTDRIRVSPVDEAQGRWRRRLVVVALAVVTLVTLWLFFRFRSDRPVDQVDILAHFKYGSIGSEPGGSLKNDFGGALPPYWLFKTMPDICPEKLPGGYPLLGLLFEEGKELPIGVSRRRRLGIDQLGLNCAVCHTGSLRDRPEAEARAILGMPAHQLDLQRFSRFVVECSLDERLTAENVAARLEAAGEPIGFLDRILLERLVTRVKLRTLAQWNRIGRVLGDAVPRWGPGRVDTFNPYKSLQFNWKLEELPEEELIGAADFPSLWNQRPRKGMRLHWDGNNDSVEERNLSAALGAGVTAVTVDHRRLRRVRDWIWTLPPPTYPYPIDEERAAQGLSHYRAHCFPCHADHRFRDGELDQATRVGTVVPIEEIGTDPYRLRSYTHVFAVAQNTLFPGSPHRFSRFRKTSGYTNQPLDGIWARAPYLHNGSVPTLRDLLEPPERRPSVFYRGYDVYDREKVGFVSTVDREGERLYFRYDTRVPGNGNGGHRYGIGLSPAEKDAIVEYLKTF